MINLVQKLKSDENLAGRLNGIKSRIEQAARLANCPLDTTLLVVSKGQDERKIRQLYALGISDFGENYAQELFAKQKNLTDLDIRWHYIGKLQSNKIKQLVQFSTAIQTITKKDHAALIDRFAATFGKNRFSVHLQVNAESEEQKAGISIAEAVTLGIWIEENCKNIDLQGLMAIPSASFHDPEDWTEFRDPAQISIHVPDIYRQLAAAAKQVGHGRLSLGMSSDFAIAIAAGSNIVRIGSAIMGERL